MDRIKRMGVALEVLAKCQTDYRRAELRAHFALELNTRIDLAVEEMGKATLAREDAIEEAVKAFEQLMSPPGMIPTPIRRDA